MTVLRIGRASRALEWRGGALLLDGIDVLFAAEFRLLQLIERAAAGTLEMSADLAFVAAKHQRAFAIDRFVSTTPHLLDLRLGGGRIDHRAFVSLRGGGGGRAGRGLGIAGAGRRGRLRGGWL